MIKRFAIGLFLFTLFGFALSISHKSYTAIADTNETFPYSLRVTHTNDKSDNACISQAVKDSLVKQMASFRENIVLQDGDNVLMIRKSQIASIFIKKDDCGDSMDYR